MYLYFAGSEIPSHRKVLGEVGASHVALSYMGLRRRIKHPENWHLSEKYPEEMHILLDSGAFTVNKDTTGYTQGELQTISDEYNEFVAANLDRVDAVTEFDALALGREWIEGMREDFYEDLPRSKFIAIWHPEWGVDYLKDMAETYSNIGIPTTDLQGRNLSPVLNGLAADGVKLHGVGATHMDDMRTIKWNSVSSTSWTSPQHYGDTIVWTGRELKRYPKSRKEQARKRYRTLFTREGFDAEKIANDDSSEVLRLSIWSWEKFVEDIEEKRNRLHVVTNPGEMDDEGFAEFEGEEVDTTTGELRNSVSTTPALVQTRETQPLPIFGVQTRTETDDEGNSHEVQDVNVRGTSQRRCDTCFLSQKCPAYQPNSTCAFNIPIEIKTREQFIQTQNALIEMQVQRVAFARFAEEIEGGYPDPNLSAEMDRLQKMLKTKNDMEQEGFSFKIEGKQTGQGGQAGMLSRLFGAQASERAQALEQGSVTVEQVQDVIDVESTEK